MGFNEAKYIWMDGEFVNWHEAKIHILSHVVHYGSSVFEGLRAYETPKGTAIFRLKDHTDRLFNSAKIYRMDVPFSKDQINDATIELLKRNELKSAYIRPLVYRGYGQLGVWPFGCPVKVSISVWDWGKYLGEDALEKGVDVMISTWRRMAPNTFPAMAKAGSNYMNSQLIKMEAKLYGYEEGIALDDRGLLSEGSGENLFLIYKGELYTPSMSSSILMGITRDSVIKIAKEMGLNVIETEIPREFIYIADEVFFTGSAAEITPIRSVDKIIIGSGMRGPITKKIQEELLGIAQGKKEDRYNWLTYVK